MYILTALNIGIVTYLSQSHQQQNKENDQITSSTLTPQRGLFISGCGFSSPPVLPAGEEWHAQTLLHHHLRVVLPRPSRRLGHDGEGQNVLQSLWSLNVPAEVPDQSFIAARNSASESSVQVCTRQPVWRDSQEVVVRLAVGGE